MAAAQALTGSKGGYSHPVRARRSVAPCRPPGHPRRIEQALAELGIALPDHHLAQRYALRRLATRFTAGEAALAELASDEWSEIEVETAEEQAFVALLPPCACCIEYTLGLDEAAWEGQLRIAARALVSDPGY
jgi:predicted regulator of Ras-like GTPase activity (Roadblock/LC7/MglB family)